MSDNDLLDPEAERPTDEPVSAWHRLRNLVVSIRHEFDKRISIVEVRMGDQNDRLERIEADLHSTKDLAQKVLDLLTAHMEQEHKDRVRLLTWIIATLLAVVGSVAFAVFDHLLP